MDWRGAVWTSTVIGGIVGALYLAAILLVATLRLPWTLSLPAAARVLAVVPAAGGIALLVWLFRFRGFRDVMVSTHETLQKLLGRLPLRARGLRTEPLVVAGPYRLVRHPMYSGILLLAIGLALAGDQTWAVLGGVLLGLWFYAVLGPFEERELVALFGDAYVAYMRTTPRLLPLPRRR